MCDRKLIGRGGKYRVSQNGLDLGRQRVELRLVEDDLECLALLVIALHHVKFGYVWESEHDIRRGIIELGRVEQAAIDRRDDLVARQDGDCAAQLPEQVGGESN